MLTLTLGLLSWLGALGSPLRPGTFAVAYAADLAILATALVFTVAVSRSRALQPRRRQLAPHEDFEADA